MLRAILCTPRGANFDLTCPYQALVSVASTQQAAACGLLQLEHAGLLCSPHSVTAMKHWSSSSRPLRCALRFRRRKRRRRPARSRSVCSPPARAGGGSTGPRPGGGQRELSVQAASAQRVHNCRRGSRVRPHGTFARVRALIRRRSAPTAHLDSTGGPGVGNAPNVQVPERRRQLSPSAERCEG